MINAHPTKILSLVSQRDFAERVGVDQSRVSRIENGSVAPSEEELESWLGAAGAADAKSARIWISAPWDKVGEPTPIWNHPDLEALAAVAHAIARLNGRTSENFRSWAERYCEELIAGFRRLNDLRYRVALMGSQAVGKSTAEARGLDLRTSSGELVLPTGGGGTTVCEMLIETGDRWGIIIEPEPAEEVRRLVEELCESARPNSGRTRDERRGLPGEVRTALLNVSAHHLHLASFVL